MPACVVWLVQANSAWPSFDLYAQLVPMKAGPLTHVWCIFAV